MNESFLKFADFYNQVDKIRFLTFYQNKYITIKKVLP